jgi:hypothetical protein
VVGESAAGSVGAGTGAAAAAGESTSSQPTHGDDVESAGGGAKFSDDGSQVLQRDVSSAAAPRQPLSSQDLALQVSTPIHTPLRSLPNIGRPWPAQARPGHALHPQRAPRFLFLNARVCLCVCVCAQASVCVLHLCLHTHTHHQLHNFPTARMCGHGTHTRSTRPTVAVQRFALAGQSEWHCSSQTRCCQMQRQ